MLGIGIKNAILFLLIILILHFLIKNVLLDRKQTPVATAKKPIESFQQTPDVKDDEHKKMLEFINEEPSLLDKAFDEKIIKDCEKQETCLPLKSDDNKIETSAMCDVSFDAKAKEDGMKVKADCKLPQVKKSFMVIKEYENERGVNGGKLFDNIDAFDSYDTYFQTYSSQCGEAK